METTAMTSNIIEFTKDWKTTNLPYSKEQIQIATDCLEQNNFPTTRTEAWKYTRLAKLSKQNFILSDSSEETEVDAIAQNGSRLVFVNGVFQDTLSAIVPETGLSLAPLSRYEGEYSFMNHQADQVFAAMNVRHAQDGVIVKIDKNSTIESPIEIIYIQTGESNATVVRNIFDIAETAKGTVILNFQSNNAENCFTNVITDIYVGPQANFTLYKVQTENSTSTFIGTENVNQDRDSYFHIHTTTLDGLLVRNDLNINVIGQNADTHLNGMYLGHGNMHVDNHTIVDHKVANCESNELYKGVMADKSTAVFNGKVFVRKDAQKINAFQSNGNVLMSDDATVNSKPELEIYADDVKCSHGSTTGQLDEEAIFYLRSRGISEPAARKLMVSAFIGDVIGKIENTEVEGFIMKKLEAKFGWNF